jgi:putative acetyltransferase
VTQGLIVLRRAEPDDRPALINLWVEAWIAAMPGIDFAARRSWFSTHLARLEQAGAVTILAGDASDGAPLGFLTCDPERHYLDQLAVRPASRGSGLAKTLIDEAKTLSPRRLSLDVNQDNPRAVRFYTREGFSIRGEGRNPMSSLATWHMVWP